MTPDLLKKAFEATSIIPVYRTKLPPKAFAPSPVLNCAALPASNNSKPDTTLSTSAADAAEELAANLLAENDQAETYQDSVELAISQEHSEANHLIEAMDGHDHLVTLPITAEEVVGMQGLIIEAEGGDPICLDVNMVGKLPIAKFSSGLKLVSKCRIKRCLILTFTDIGL